MNNDWDAMLRKMTFDESLERFKDAVDAFDEAEREWLFWANLAMWAQWSAVHKN